MNKENRQIISKVDTIFDSIRMVIKRVKASLTLNTGLQKNIYHVIRTKLNATDTLRSQVFSFKRALSYL